MARERIRAAQRKAERVRQLVIGDGGELSATDVVAVGVRQVARDIAGEVPEGALWWRAPLQFVAEQMAVRVCKARRIPEGRRDDMAAYLLSGVSEFVVALASDFDEEHFEAWTAAAKLAESG